MKRVSFFCVFVWSLVLGANVQASENYGFPWKGPTFDRLHAGVESGWNLGLIGGLSVNKGEGRSDFIDPGPWKRGWISELPWMEARLAYAPNTSLEFGFQVPITVLNSSFNIYYRWTDYLGTGLKLGAVPALFANVSVYPGEKIFINFSPGITIPTARKSNLEFTSESDPNVRSSVSESWMILTAQLSVGVDTGLFDVALLTQYGFAPGSGLESSFLFDDAILKHFFKVGGGLSF
jgi:hypothetical protein